MALASQAGLWGLRPPGSPRTVRSTSQDSRSLPLPYRGTHPGAAVVGYPPTTASHAVCSPSACSRCEAATHPGGTSPRYVPSQRFSRSQGLAPPHACRPCFMPVPPLGFYPSRPNPPAELYALSSAHALLRFTTRSATAPTHPARQITRRPASPRRPLAKRRHALAVPLQGVAPCRRPYPAPGCLGQTQDRDPRGLHPP
jgi:hypothetical protein